jgi:hypothetical protein
MFVCNNSYNLLQTLRITTERLRAKGLKTSVLNGTVVDCTPPPGVEVRKGNKTASRVDGS